VWRRAIEAGATFWGDRDGQIVDPFGHRWGLSQHLHDVSLEEMTELAARAFPPSPDTGHGAAG
jgi:PhnB protein